MVHNIGSAGNSFFIKQYEKTAAAPDESGFKETLRGLTDRFDSVQAQATNASQAVVAGEPVESHDVMIAAQEAGLAFDLMLEVRNKLLDAYNELMRMQV